MKKRHLLIITLFLCSLVFILPTSVADDDNIRIIQGAVYINDNPDNELLSEGINIKINISDGQNVTVSTGEYSADDDLNFGKGFASIAKNETVNFSVELNGIFQEPDEITLDGNDLPNGYLRITDETIYHVNLYYLEDLPYNPSPANDSTNVDINQNISWKFDETGKNNLIYHIYFDTETPPTYIDNSTNKSFNPGQLKYNTTYYWKINATTSDDYWESEQWRFTTMEDPHPTADAGGPYEGFTDQAIQFSGSASKGKSPYNYSWDFDDGSTSAEQNPTHTFSQAKTYEVTFTVTDDDGYSATDSTTVTIENEQEPSPTASITSLNIQAPDELKVGEELDLDITAVHSEENIMSFTIDWGDDSDLTTRQGLSDFTFTETHTYDSTGEYTISVTASDPDDVAANERTQTHSISIVEGSEEAGGFPWIYIFLIVIIIAVVGVLFYLYQNDQLPYVSKKSSSSSSDGMQSIKNFFKNPFNKNKTMSPEKSEDWSSTQSSNHQSIPQPMQSSTAKSNQKESSSVSQLTSSGDSKKASSSQSTESTSEKNSTEKNKTDEDMGEFKRL